MALKQSLSQLPVWLSCDDLPRKDFGRATFYRPLRQITLGHGVASHVWPLYGYP